nr:PREDICTED: uncharacterized protein LOC107079935 [Lepisosteus oculatus]XP_015223027.1 PREDICTED: uncharacterized protein LOC107079935 [Lepisosteus oculatus]
MEGLKRNHLLVITAILGLVMQVIAQNNSTIPNPSPSPETNSFNTSSLTEKSATSPSQNSSTQSKTSICSTATPSRKPGCQSEAFYLQCVFTEGQVLDLLTVSAVILAFVMLLLSTTVLSCKLCFLKRRSGRSRPTRTNVDLVAGQSYRPQGGGGGGDASEPGKEAGLSETSVMMAELQPQAAPAEMEQAEGGPANGTQDPGSTAAAGDPESNSAAPPPEEPSPSTAEEIGDIILVA